MEQPNYQPLSYGDIRFIRDTIKETLECDEVDNVRQELEEIMELLEGVLD